MYNLKFLAKYPFLGQAKQWVESLGLGLGEIENHFKDGKKLLKKMRDSVGVDDPIYQKLEPVMMVYEKAYNNIDFFIEKGKSIEDFHLDTM